MHTHSMPVEPIWVTPQIPSLSVLGSGVILSPLENPNPLSGDKGYWGLVVCDVHDDGGGDDDEHVDRETGQREHQHPLERNRELVGEEGDDEHEETDYSHDDGHGVLQWFVMGSYFYYRACKYCSFLAYTNYAFLVTPFGPLLSVFLYYSLFISVTTFKNV